MAHLLKTLVVSWFVKEKLLLFMAKLSREDLTLVSQLLETGKVKPVIDRYYRLSEVPEALRHQQEGHARGKVVITLSDTSVP